MDQRHAQMLEIVSAHEVSELCGDVDAIMATFIPEPTYALWNGHCLEGQAPVREMYTRITAVHRGKPRPVATSYDVGWSPVPHPHVVPAGRRGIWVNDDAVVLDYLMRMPGTTRLFPLVAVIPFEDGLMRGEHVTTVPEYAEFLDSRIGDLSDMWAY